MDTNSKEKHLHQMKEFARDNLPYYPVEEWITVKGRGYTQWSNDLMVVNPEAEIIFHCNCLSTNNESTWTIFLEIAGHLFHT